MVLGLLKKKDAKAPPKVMLKNLAVQTVGETYFRVALVGLVAAAVLAIVAIVIGASRGLFEFNIDRCDCLLTSGAQDAIDEGQDCVFGADLLGVTIGWKSFVVERASSTDGCLDGWQGKTDIGSPFGDGIYSKKSMEYGNGATGAADACVGMFVASALVSIIMYKTVKMSYTGPGSIYSIGLHNIAMMCALLSVGSTISVMAFWGRVRGVLGVIGDSLAATLFKAALDVCEDDWDTVGFPINDEVFCQAAPWTFDVPLYAGWTAIAHVAVMFLTAVWILCKSSLVEGVLDGSILSDGKAVPPRVVEFEQAVGRALATTEDPDYDVPDNKLYTGEQKVMIRPYPLPSSVKKATKAVVKAIVSPLRKSAENTPRSRAYPSKHAMEQGFSLGSNVGDTGGPFSPRSLGIADEDELNESTGLTEPKGADKKSVHEPTSPIAKASSKAARKSSKKAAKVKAQAEAVSSPKAEKPSHSKKSRQFASQREGREGWDDDGGSGSSVIRVTDGADSSPGAAYRLICRGRTHEKTRSEVDWSSIMEAGGSGQGNGGGGEDESSHLESGMLGDLDMMFHGPSAKDGLTLGAITEDPREDMISEFTITPRKKESDSQFEV
ncbi:unnamed protein product [Pylaiella littoralis]